MSNINNNITLQFTDYNKVDGKTLYYMQVRDNEQTWILSARYSYLEEIHKELKEINKKIPDFPKKKMFGNDDPKFISKRQKELEHYFLLLIENPTKYNLKPLYDFLQSGKKKTSTINSNINDQLLASPNNSINKKSLKEASGNIEKENYDKFTTKLVQVPKKNENYLLDEASEGNKTNREQININHILDMKKNYRLVLQTPTDIHELEDKMMGNVLHKYGNQIKDILNARYSQASNYSEFVQKISSNSD